MSSYVPREFCPRIFPEYKALVRSMSDQAFADFGRAFWLYPEYEPRLPENQQTWIMVKSKLDAEFEKYQKQREEQSARRNGIEKTINNNNTSPNPNPLLSSPIGRSTPVNSGRVRSTPVNHGNTVKSMTPAVGDTSAGVPASTMEHKDIPRFSLDDPPPILADVKWKLDTQRPSLEQGLVILGYPLPEDLLDEYGIHFARCLASGIHFAKEKRPIITRADVMNWLSPEGGWIHDKFIKQSKQMLRIQSCAERRGLLLKQKEYYIQDFILGKDAEKAYKVDTRFSAYLCNFLSEYDTWYHGLEFGSGKKEK